MKGKVGIYLLVRMTYTGSKASHYEGQSGVISCVWGDRLSINSEQDEFVQLILRVCGKGGVEKHRERIIAELEVLKQEGRPRSVLHLYKDEKLVGFLYVQGNAAPFDVVARTLYSSADVFFKYLLRAAQRELSGKEIRIVVFDTQEDCSLLTSLGFQKERSGIFHDGGSFCRLAWQGTRDESDPFP